MKINYWTPYMGNVGTIKATINSAIAIKNLGHETKIYKTYREWEGYEELLQKENIKIIDFGLWKKIENLPKHKLGFRISMLIISIHSFFKLLKNYNNEKPDIIISSLLGYFPIFVRFFSKHKPIVINSIQGMPRFNLFRKVLWNFLYKKSDLIITLTEETRENLVKQLNFDNNKIVIVPNPIIDKNVDLLKEEMVQEEIFYEKLPLIIGMGRLTKQKNFETLVKAFEIVEKKIESKLVILGEGEEREKLEELISNRKLQNKVYLFGYVKNPYKYISKSDLFVLSSLWEDQGHALVEAAYMRIPIVCTKCPRGQEEFLEFGEAGTLCEVGDEIDMAEKIIQVLERISNENIIQKQNRAYENSLNFTIKKHGNCLEKFLLNTRSKNDNK